MIEQSYKFLLFFNANKIYDRGVMQAQLVPSITMYLGYFVEAMILVHHKNSIESLSIDGIIADFDDLETVELILKYIDVPL